MTDRFVAVTVVLEREIREDDAQPILTALSLVKGVQSVHPVVGGIEIDLAQERARWEMLRAIGELVRNWGKAR